MNQFDDRKVTKQDLEKEIFDLKNLLEISKSLSSTLDYGLLNDSILYTCLGALTVIRAAFFYKKSIDSKDFVLHRGFLGFEIDHEREYLIPEKCPLIEFLTQNHGCYTLNELMKTLPNNAELELLTLIDPRMVVPLKAKGEVNGLLILGGKIDGDDFNDRDKDYLLSIGNFAAIAIHNAFLFEMTTTDMMTKLKLKHFFLNHLQEKMRHLPGTKNTISLIMVDIDKFKLFNDTYGHLAGDDVLKSVAGALLDSVRIQDVAARYGGEEFILLISDANLQRATEVAERVRKAVERNVVQFHNEALKVTISLGVGEYDPLKDTTPQAFIERVDRALYHSKEAGRNRTSAAQ